MGGNGDDAVDRLVIRAVEPGCQESIDLQWEMRRELDAMYDETTIDPPPLEQFRLPRAAFFRNLIPASRMSASAIWCGQALSSRRKRRKSKPKAIPALTIFSYFHRRGTIIPRPSPRRKWLI